MLNQVRRRKRAASTREQLVDFAAKRFLEKGYAATGVAEILEDVGVGAGSLYHHFGSKEDLALAVLDRYAERFRAEIREPVHRTTADPIERIFGVLGFYVDYLGARKCRDGCPIGNLANELADSHPVIRARIAALFAQWTETIRESLRAAAPRLPRDTDVDALATFVLSVMEGGVMQARVARTTAPLEASIRQLRDYFDRMLDSRRR